MGACLCLGILLPIGGLCFDRPLPARIGLRQVTEHNHRLPHLYPRGVNGRGETDRSPIQPAGDRRPFVSGAEHAHRSWGLDPLRTPVAQDDGDAPLADAPAYFCVGDFELDEVGAHALGWREVDHTLHSLVLAPGQDKMTCVSLPPTPRQTSMLLRELVATSMHTLGMKPIYSGS